MSITIDVYDQIFEEALADVTVSILEVEQEIDGIWESVFNDDRLFYYTDDFGRIVIESRLLAIEEVGFEEDYLGEAVLSSDLFNDEARVLVEVSIETLNGVIYVERLVFLSWVDPDAYAVIFL